MLLPAQWQVKNSRTLLRVFGGLNETYGCGEAEYSSGINFSSRDFPALSTRIPRRRLRAAAQVNGMHHLNGLLLVCGTRLEYTPDDPALPAVVREDAVANSRKTLVSMGSRILIWPDKLSFDTLTGELTELGAVWSGAGVCFTPCDADGIVYPVTEKGETLPADPADGALFLQLLDPAHPWSAANVLQRYSAAQGGWSSIRLDHCRAEAAGIGAAFARWDSVSVQGAAAELLRLDPALDGAQTLIDCAPDRVLFAIDPAEDAPLFYGSFTQNAGSVVWCSPDGSESRSFDGGGALTLAREIPALDFVTECGNRLWGCSSAENVIYACKLGDPTNWYSYRGIASDSYAVTVGSDGPFTGAASCMGYVVMFKESTLHKIYGSRPSDFQTSTLRCRGVAANAARSMCVINEVLYYLSPEGVMAWEGSLPVKVSAALSPDGIANATRAAGAQLDGRYYLQITRPAPNGAEENRLLVLDTEKGIWHEESAGGFEMAATGRQLYLWDGQAVWAAEPSREPDWAEAPAESMEREVRFEWVSGEIGLDRPEEKYVSRVLLRADAAAPAVLRVELSCDGGPWTTVDERTVREPRQRLSLPFVPRRCDTFRLRLSGRGHITLRAVSLTLSPARP